MSGTGMRRTPHSELLEVIRRVRTRWRLKLALRGIAIVAAAGVLAFLVTSYGVEKAGFSAGAVVGFRLLLWAAVAFVALRWLAWPLRKRVSAQQVALYLEEHEPTLDATVLSALDLGDDAAATSAGFSPVLVRRTIETAIERVRRVDEGRRIDGREIRNFGGVLAAASIVALAMLVVRPAFVRHGASALLNPLAPAGNASPYRIAVEPGNVTIPRGADQMIGAALVGFAGERAELVLRQGADSAFERLEMVPADSGAFEILLFDVGADTEYFVESNGVRSPVHRITVADLPYVDRLTLEYRFPAYTGLPPRVVEDGGDIAVPHGTVVAFHATTTVPAARGRVVLDDGSGRELTADTAGVLTGTLPVEREGYYHVELQAAAGQMVNASPQYRIELLEDLPPVVRFAKPGRDTRPTPIEEVFLEAVAEDDYGVASLELVYSVNGGEERVVPLHSTGRAVRDVSAGHTLYLEELGLEPGDLVAYHARVRDNRPGGGVSATSDIYFLSVRPFGQEYRQAEQQGGGGGGGGGDQGGDLSEQQREIVAATFNTVRDSATTAAKDLAENINTIALSQERLREEVNTLVERMRNRQVTQDSNFLKIAELLPQAAEQMAEAVRSLRAGTPGGALPPEQRALQILQRAEAVFREVQIAMGQQGGGGGGGGGGANAEDLADLFELELDKLRNQYETVQRGEQQQSDNQRDEALERLRELARRQQQETERLRQQAGQRQAGGGGGEAQRQLAEETEEAARQLERLARETSQPQLEDAARRLREAADAMRRSASNARTGGTAEANQALERLEEARRRLEQNRSDDVQQRADQAAQQAERLAREQRGIGEGMRELPQQGQNVQAEARRLRDRKDQQLAQVQNLERELDALARQAAADDREASRELQRASNMIRDDQLKERIQYSKNLTDPRALPEYVDQTEREIEEALDSVSAMVRRAAGSFQGGTRSEREEAVERARNLARGLESMEERARQRLEAGEERGQGEQGEQQGQGQQEQGQQGQQGQGQQGQQGQGQQSQGQQGQQGQGQQGQQGQGQGGQQGQGQGGQQGQQGERGGQGGMQGGFGGWADGRGTWGGDDIRQFRSEARQRLQEAEALRSELRRQGQDTQELDEVIRDLRELTVERNYADPRGIAELQAAVVDGIKQFEFRLRRELMGEQADALFLGGSDAVPEGYRELVEEYYRRLARQNR